ncbi:MAG: septum formation inhibitor Maf [Ignavibacteria bacterium]|nr:septum formation inhibitor Maf [Ignavibacteria bacterium]
MFVGKKLILASGSPRRRHLLNQLGLEFEARESGADEENNVPNNPGDHVRILSERKARAVADDVGDGIVIGADTIVVLDGAILGKPKDPRHAVAMLSMLSGRTHEVYTGFTLLDCSSKKKRSAVEVTKVTFRQLMLQEIEEYVASGSPLDKAGAYGIQDDYGAVFVESIHGCFYNVVGFPLSRFYIELRQFQKELGLL